MQLDRNMELAVFSVLVALGTLATTVLVSVSKIGELDLFKAIAIVPIEILKSFGITVFEIPGAAEITATVFSFPVIALAIVFPFTFAIISVLSHLKDKMFTYKATIAGSVVALLLSLILFGFGAEKLVLALFYFISLLAVVELSYVKKEEVKTLITYRTASFASQKAFLVIALGLLVSSAIVLKETNEQRVEAIGNEFFDAVLKNTSATSGLEGITADVLISQQKQALATITFTPQFQRLAIKPDTDVQAFVFMMNGMQQNIDNPGYREKIVEEVKKVSGQATKSLSFSSLRESIPLFDAGAKYYWALGAVTITTTFIFIANLLAANLAGLYAAGLRKIIELLLKQ